MKINFKSVLFIFCLCLTIEVQAVTDYANSTTDYEGEYKSTHNDITTVGVPEKEPTLEQAEEIRKKNLEDELKPPAEPKPDLDPAQPADKVLLQKIENGAHL